MKGVALDATFLCMWGSINENIHYVLGHKTATKVICVAGSLIVVVKKKTRG